MVRNIPVDVARNLCADVVIVVNLVEQELKREELQTATQLLLRSADVGIMANENLQLDSLTDRDVRIDVIMGGITTADFERVPETIPLGEKAARGMADKLARLAVPEAEYHAWRTAVTAGQGIEARLADVKYEGLQRVNPEYLQQRAEVKPGDTVDTAAISAEAQRMSRHAGVRVSRVPADGRSRTARRWSGGRRRSRYGPNYLKFDLGLYGSEDGDLGFVVYGKHTRTWLNSLGAEWRNEVQLGHFNYALDQLLPAARHRADASSSSRSCSGPDRGRISSTTTNDWRATSSATGAPRSTSAPISATTRRCVSATCTRRAMRASKPAR